MTSATNKAHAAANSDHQDWIEWLARAGYAAKGVVYFIVGVLAVQVAMGDGGQTAGTKGALAVIAGEPFGQILLVVTGIGLLGYAVWKFVQAATDPEHKGTDAKGVCIRGAYVCSAILHTALAIEALRLVMGYVGGGGDNSAQHWTAKLMQQPFGPWLVGLAGVAILIAGGVQAYRAYSANFMKKLKPQEMSATERTWSERIGRAGFAARAVVYFIVAGGLIAAAMASNPNEAMGMGQALSTLASQSYGPWLLGLVAVGLVAYGVFSTGILARYRRIIIDT